MLGRDADASKMHPLFQALCLIICSGILPYLTKTADSDVVFSKVSPLAIFAGNKIGENTTSLFLEKKHVGQKDGHEGVPEGQKRWPHTVIDCTESKVTFNVKGKEHTIYFPRRKL